MVMIEELLPNDGNGPYRVLRAVSSSAVKSLGESLNAPEKVQQKALGKVLDSARGTVFAADHGLEKHMDLDAFRRSIPIRPYEALGEYFERVAQGEAGVLTRHKVRQLFWFYLIMK